MCYIFYSDLLRHPQPEVLCRDALFTRVTGLRNPPTGLAPDINAARQHLSKGFTYKDYLPNKAMWIATVLHCYGRKME